MRGGVGGRGGEKEMNGGKGCERRKKGRGEMGEEKR